jgi:hypothetical protein
VVEGDDLAASGEVEKGFVIVRRAEEDIRGDQSGTIVRSLREETEAQTKRYGCLQCHSGELAGADDTDVCWWIG